MQDISPVSGWSLDYIVALDTHWPGTAGAFLRASAERRQVVAALLSAKPIPKQPIDAAKLAEFVSRANHKEILKAAFETVPTGMRGALARAGHEPHPRAFYRILFRLLACPNAGVVASVIQQLDHLDLKRLRIAKLLPDDICVPGLVGIIENVGTARDVCRIVQLLTDGGVNRQALVEALKQVASAEKLSELWCRWSLKMAFPPHPIAATDQYVTVANGAELQELARRYRNCAKLYLAQSLEGQSAFAEFRGAEGSAVIHLSRDGDQWALEGVYAEHNGRVASEVRSAAVEFLEKHDVRTRRQKLDSATEWGVLRRLSYSHMLEFEFR